MIGNNELSDILGKEVIFLGAPKKFTRNNVRYYLIDDNKKVIKEHDSDLFFYKEKINYPLLQNEPGILVPSAQFYPKHRLIVIDYIKRITNRNIEDAVLDWGGIHSNNFGRKSLSKRKAGSLKWVNELIEDLKSHKGCCSEYADDYINYLKSVSPIFELPSWKTLVHGDLRSVNISPTKKGNYYYDLEFTGEGHPAEDIAPIVLEEPERKEQIIQMYLEKTQFNKETFLRELEAHIVLRALSILTVYEDRNINSEIKERVIQKFTDVIGEII